MLAVLPIVALGAAIVACEARLKYWREAILAGAVVWGAILAASTEFLSLLHLLTVAGVSAVWLTTTALALVYTVHEQSRAARPVAPILKGVGRFHRPETLFFGILGAILLTLVASAVVSAPNTWDSMTYHLARLIHWEQNASLAPYPTHVLRQLYLQPGAEYALLNLQLLSGGDHLAGLFQWASLIGVLIGTSLIAQQLGGGSCGTLCAVAFAGSIPIGVLESTSTQNDVVVAFWLVCLTWIGLRIGRLQTPRPAWPLAVGFGAGLGLALITKATAYLFAPPLLVLLTVVTLRRWRWRGVAFLVLAFVIAFAVNLGFYARNLTVFGSPVGPPDEGAPSLRYFNDGLTPGMFVSNVLRDVGVNLVATPFVSVNVRSFNAVKQVHTWLGINIQDERSTWDDERFQEQSVGYAFNENFASNPIHVVLLLLAVCVVWPLRRRLDGSVVQNALALVGGFVLFAAILRWQPWHTRLELPLFVLGAPLVGIVAERVAPRLTHVLAILLLASALPWVVNNHARPLIGPTSILATSRTDQYFTYHPSLQQGYENAVAVLAERGCTQTGFVSDQDGWEYPLRAISGQALRIEHINVTNVSASFGSSVEAFTPCAIVTVTSTSVEVTFP